MYGSCIRVYTRQFLGPGWHILHWIVSFASLHDLYAAYPDVLCMMRTVLITFADLELLLFGLNTLRTLRLVNGVDSTDGRDQIPDRNHGNALKTLHIHNHNVKFRVGARQLCWLVCPTSPTMT